MRWRELACAGGISHTGTDVQDFRTATFGESLVVEEDNFAVLLLGETGLAEEGATWLAGAGFFTE